MKVVTIGRGNVGRALAERWTASGHDVVLVGRDGGSAHDADVVVVAVPSDQIGDALRKVAGAGGKVAIDVTNPFEGRTTDHPSLAHQVRAHIGGPVAKAFNLQHHTLYAHVDAQSSRPSNLYAADDGARSAVTELSRAAGFDPVPVGGLEMARALEDAVALFGAVRRNGGGPHFHRFARPGEL